MFPKKKKEDYRRYVTNEDIVDAYTNPSVFEVIPFGNHPKNIPMKCMKCHHRPCICPKSSNTNQINKKRWWNIFRF